MQNVVELFQEITILRNEKVCLCHMLILHLIIIHECKKASPSNCMRFFICLNITETQTYKKESMTDKA